MLYRYIISDGKQRKQAKIYTQDEHKIDASKIDKHVIRIISKLVSHGFEAYLVGGAVRDLLIGKTPKDFDITTEAKPRTIKKLFRNSRIIGRRFRLVHVFFGKKIFEVCTFRSTENGSVGNKFGTIEEDAHRRDFTINALYFDPLKSQLIDFVNGFEDLHAGKLKPVIPLKFLFVEDPVRMIRAAKYSILAECKMNFFLKCNIHAKAHLLETVSHSRLTEEMNKIMHSGHSADIIENLVHFNLYQYLQPNACILLNENIANYRTLYFESLHNLDLAVKAGKAKRQGAQFFYFIEDFLNLILKNVGKETPIYFYTEARRFVLPLNPQREEMRFAVIKFLRKNNLIKNRKGKRKRRKN